jgi:hypothetical protein
LRGRRHEEALAGMSGREATRLGICRIDRFVMKASHSSGQAFDWGGNAPNSMSSSRCATRKLSLIRKTLIVALPTSDLPINVAPNHSK